MVKKPSLGPILRKVTLMQKLWLLGLAAVVCLSALVAVLSLGPATPEDSANIAKSADETTPPVADETAPPVVQGEAVADEKVEPAVPASTPVAAPAPPLVQAETPVDEPAEAKPDLYAVPEGDTAALVKFINDIQSMRPAASSQLEVIEHLKKSTAAQIVAAERILAGDASDDALKTYRSIASVPSTGWEKVR